MRLKLATIATIFVVVLGIGVVHVRRVHAQNLKGFLLWTHADLQAKEKVLNGKLGPDHSAREQLFASNGQPTQTNGDALRLVHRVGTGQSPEFHAHFIDLWFVQSGKATLVVGGKMIGAKPSASGDMIGTGIEGGERHEIGAGDVVHIPINTPHEALVPEGGEITYIRLGIPVQ